MTYDQLRRFTSCFLTFKSNIVNLNVIPSEFKKFDGTEFRTLKIIVNNFTFIILCLKHIIYSFLPTRHAPAELTIGATPKVKYGKCAQSYEDCRHQIKNDFFFFFVRFSPSKSRSKTKDGFENV
eukprot:719782_1